MSYNVTSTKECRDYICVDLETTGLSVYGSEIIEIGAVKVTDGEIGECYTTLIRPTQSIEASATKVNGITDEDVADAPLIADVFGEFMDFIGDSILLGHNISSFDITVLRNTGIFLHRHVENKYIDTLQVAKKLLPDLPSHSLETLCEYYGIDNKQAHRALSDCFATIEVYNAMMAEKEGNARRISKEKKEKTFFSHMSDTSRLLIRLIGIIEGVTCDGNMNEKELSFLDGWLSHHTELSGNYQYDAAVKAVRTAIDNPEEKEFIVGTLKGIIDPITNKTERPDSSIDFSGKTVCLSGEFEGGTKAEIEERLIKYGATICPSVIKSLDYLIIGGHGSQAWSLGNYGAKVKKALEFQEKGRKVQIIRECDAFKE